MRLLLILVGLAFLVVPAVELWVLVLLNRHMGLGPTIGLLLLTGAVGFWLAKWQGWRTLRRIRAELAVGRMPSAAMVDGALIMAAGLLLLTPGLLTDAVGFLLLVPPTRFVVRRLLVWWFTQRLPVAVFSAGVAGRPSPDDPGTVEGRVVSVEDADRRLP
jgi:UPF0716 protein FxsA